MSMKKYNQTITTIHVPHYIVSFSFNSPFSHKWKFIFSCVCECGWEKLKTESSYSEWADDEFEAMRALRNLLIHTVTAYTTINAEFYYMDFIIPESQHTYILMMYIVFMYVKHTYIYLLQFYVWDRQVVYKKISIKNPIFYIFISAFPIKL